MAQLVGTQRRRAAILVADMVGYSRLMEAFEEYTFCWQRRLRLEILDPGIVATSLRAHAFPGEDSTQLTPPDGVSDAFVDLAEAACARHGEIIRVQPST